MVDFIRTLNPGRMPHGLMSELNDRVVDPRQDIVCQKRHGVRQCRRRHGGWIQDMRQTGQTPQVPVVGGQIRQPVKVDVQTRLHHSKHQDLPDVHARPAIRTVDPFAVTLPNEIQTLIPGLGVTPQRLQGITEHLGIVPGLGVEGEILDRDGTQRGLRIQGLSHKVPPVVSLGA